MAITIPIITDFNSRGIDTANKQFKKLETSGQRAASSVRKAAVPAGLALLALGAAAFDSAKAAMEDAAAQSLLTGQLDRVTGASDRAISGVDEYITKLSMATGIADDQLRPALGKLATATGSLTKAQDLLSLSLDIAAQTNKPLEAVTTTLGKAYGGNLGAIKKLIPGFDEAIIKSKDFGRAQEELALLTGGAAAEASETAAGKMRKFGVTIDETKEAIGAALLPIIEKVLPFLQGMAKWVGENSTTAAILAAAVGGLAASIVLLNIGMTISTAVMPLLTAETGFLSAAMTANPVGVVVVGLALLATALVVAYKKSGTFREAVNNLGSVVRSVFGWISENIGPIIDVAVAAFKVWIKPIELVVTLIGKVKDFLGSFSKDVGPGMAQTLADLSKKSEDAVVRIAKIPAKVQAAIRGARSALSGLVGGVAGMAGQRAGAAKTAEADALQKQLDNENAIREEAGLRAAITAAETDGEKAAAELALTKFLTAQKIAAFREEAAAASQSASDRVTELNTAYQTGLKSADEFKTALNDIIGESAGQTMGAGFAFAFDVELANVRAQLAELSSQVPQGAARLDVGVPTPTGISESKKKPKKKKPKKKMATGGIVTRETDVTIGEAGPEAVIPLSRARGFGVGGITINVQAGLVSTPDQIGQQIIEAIQNAQRRSGPVFAAA